MCYENLGENHSCQSSELLLYLGGAAEVTNGYNNGEQKKNISWDIPHVTLVIYPLIPGTALPNNNQHVSDTYF